MGKTFAHYFAVSDYYCFNCSGKGVAGDKVSSGSKRKATKDGTEPDGLPQYSCWLMKSEPDSRLENGVDVKV